MATEKNGKRYVNIDAAFVMAATPEMIAGLRLVNDARVEAAALYAKLNSIHPSRVAFKTGFGRDSFEIVDA